MDTARVERCIFKPMVQESFDRRIEWCDIFKGIIILLVVTGHCTSFFNQWIYQFHMAAFFFISGYTSRWENKFDYLVKRFYQLVLPYYTINLIGVISFWALNKMNLLHMISTIEFPDRIQDAIRMLFKNERVFCDWLGAMWFLPVLFLANVFLVCIVGALKRKWVVLIVSVLTYLCFMSTGLAGGFFFIKLAGMAQLFMVYGYLLKEGGLDLRTIRTSIAIVLSIVISVIWIILRINGFSNTVDWPSSKFNGWSDIFLPLLGIFLSINISLLLSRIDLLKKTFILLGNNSMGIMCFHFIGFKFAYIILILLGRMSWDEFHLLTPPYFDMGWECVLIVTIAVVISIVLWEKITEIKWIKILFGKDKRVVSVILQLNFMKNMEKTLSFLLNTVKESLNNFSLFIKINIKKWQILLTILIIGILLFVTKIVPFYKPIEISFPYYRNMISFGEGWLPQSQTEEYRWICMNSVFNVFLINQDYLSVDGYIPEGVENVSCFKIKVNDVEVYSENVQSNFLINVQKLNIKDYIHEYMLNKIEIEIDGKKHPSESDADQRELSALINHILLE